MKETRVGRVSSLHRYPVKSMAGEDLPSAEVTPTGLLGDRAYALIDRETGRVVSAKRPRRWTGILDYRASFTEPPKVTTPSRWNPWRRARRVVSSAARSIGSLTLPALETGPSDAR